MENNTVTQTIVSTINYIFEQIFGSVDNNLYSTLDNITFINSNILKNNFFENILGTSATNGILLISNSLLLRNYFIFCNKIFIISFNIFSNRISFSVYF